MPPPDDVPLLVVFIHRQNGTREIRVYDRQAKRRLPGVVGAWVGTGPILESLPLGVDQEMSTMARVVFADGTELVSSTAEDRWHGDWPDDD